MQRAMRARLGDDIDDCSEPILSIATIRRLMRHAPQIAGHASYGASEFEARHRVRAERLSEATLHTARAYVELFARRLYAQAARRADEAGRATVDANDVQNALGKLARSMPLTAGLPIGGIAWARELRLVDASLASELDVDRDVARNDALLARLEAERRGVDGDAMRERCRTRAC